MAGTFHLSLAVPDLMAARAFYADTLGCAIGRDQGSWIDVHFFGHQLTLHQASEDHAAVAVDHFGPVLGKAQWQALLARVCDAGHELAGAPIVRDEGQDTESGKFLVHDPAGNLLEVKYYVAGDAFAGSGNLADA